MKCTAECEKHLSNTFTFNNGLKQWVLYFHLSISALQCNQDGTREEGIAGSECSELGNIS